MEFNTLFCICILVAVCLMFCFIYVSFEAIDTLQKLKRNIPDQEDIPTSVLIEAVEARGNE